MTQLYYPNRVKHSPASATLYNNRKSSKHQQEVKLVQSAFQYLQGDGTKTVLDAPCGVGRMTELLDSMGFVARGCDLGEAAVELAREKAKVKGLDVHFDQANLEHLPYRSGQFDASLCFRFFHHLPEVEIQEKIIAELCRVSAQHVVISIFSPYSYTSIKRETRQKLGGKASIQHTTKLADLDKLFAPHQFVRQTVIKQPIPLKTLQLVIYSKEV